MKKFLFVLTALLAAALLFTACSEGEGEEEEGGGGSTTTNQEMSFNWISVHPTSADYAASAATIQPLKVAVAASAGSGFKYQWYKADTFTNSGGSAINSASTDTYTPSAADITADGSFYYAVVTRTADGKTQPSNPARLRVLASAPTAPTATVTIGSENKQYVRGFGGMSNAFTIGAPARYMELSDIDTMFNPDYGLGLKILRIIIWPNPLDEVIRGQVEPQMNNQRTYLQAVKMVNKFGGYVLASPWTPPSDWKVNGSPNGTSPSYLLSAYYGAYARYLANYAREMDNLGSPIYTLSIQNEPSWPASYAGCEWTSNQQRDFFKNANVGKFTAGVPGFGGGKQTTVKIMSGEPHQDVTWNNAARNDPVAHAAIDIYSFHTYGNHNNAYPAVQADNDLNRKELWMTEWNQNSGEGNYEQDSTWNFVWIFTDAVDNDVRCDSVNAFVWWYSKRFYSFIGDNSYGTVNGQVQPRGYIISHYAKYATDTVRIPATVNNHPAGGNTSDSQASTGYSSNINVKASAFRRKPASARSGYWENQVEADEDSISLVIYDKRTASGTQGPDVRVSLPDNFGAAKYAHAIISDSSGKRHAPHIIVLNADGKTADFNLPANSIVSVKFSK